MFMVISFFEFVSEFIFDLYIKIGPFLKNVFFHGTQVFQFSKFLHLRGNFCFRIQKALFQNLILFFKSNNLFLRAFAMLCFSVNSLTEMVIDFVWEKLVVQIQHAHPLLDAPVLSD